MQRRPVLFASATMLCAVVLMLVFINPVWQRLDLHVPGEPAARVDFTQPVDSIFYVRNAVFGYRWIDTPTSIWFHPAVVWAIDLLPGFIAANWRLWVVSILSGFSALILLNKYINEISTEDQSPWLLLVVPFLPGGLGIATGNAEFPCLTFTSLLILSILRKHKWYFPVVWGALAILTKPNAIYMIAGLVVYLFWAQMHRDLRIARNSVMGIAGIIAAWAIWVLYVDTQAGHFGTYWSAREITFPSSLTTGFLDFMKRAIENIVYTQNQGEALKFITALVIPLVDIWILQIIPMKSEAHRLSILFSVLAMLIIAMVPNNPNKVIVYSTTFPGHLAIGLLFIQHAFRVDASLDVITQSVKILAGVSYLAFCILMAVFYVVGTPLMWYY